MLEYEKSEFHPCCSMMLSMMGGLKNVDAAASYYISASQRIQLQLAMQCNANLHPLNDYKLCLSRPTVCLQIVHIHHHHQSNPEEEVDFNWSVN